MSGIRQWRHLPNVVGALTVVGLVLLLEVLIRAGVINRFLVPPPSEILLGFQRVIIRENIAGRFLQTVGECLAAGILMTLIGVALGTVINRYQVLRAACENWIAAWASAPIIMTYPLFLVVFGRSVATIVGIALFAALPSVILKTIEGLSGTRAVLINVGRSFNMTPSQQFWKIMLPAALPTIFVGVRLGMMFILVVVVAAEYLINFGGLGQLVNEMAERYEIPAMFATIFFVVLVSVVTFYSLERLENWTTQRR